MNNTGNTISALQSSWKTLHDLDRARAVHRLHKSGMSFNEIAKAIPCSPSLLRHLIAALGAPKADQLLARDGKLTTSQLVRCAKVAKIRHGVEKKEAIDLKRTKESIAGCKVICDWLIREGRQGPYGERIILEAQRFLAEGEQTGKLPPGAMPPGMQLTELIQRSRPPELKTDEVDPMAWFGFWLARWAYYLMPNSSVRYRAFELAYDKQFGR